MSRRMLSPAVRTDGFPRAAAPTPVLRALHQLVSEALTELIALALEEELAHLLRQYEHLKLPDGARAVVRNGYLPERAIRSSVGEIAVKVPRARDRSNSGVVHTSTLVPPYHSRSCVDTRGLLPASYLRSHLGADVRALLTGVLGERVGRAPEAILDTVQGHWSRHVCNWRQRTFSQASWLVWWAGSVAGAQEEDEQLLFIIGMSHAGGYELVGAAQAHGDPERAWIDMLRGLRERHLSHGPRIVEEEGSPGFWRALQHHYPDAATAGHVPGRLS